MYKKPKMNNDTNNYANIWSAPEHAPVQLSLRQVSEVVQKGIRDIVKKVANDKLAPAFSTLNASAASLKNKQASGRTFRVAFQLQKLRSVHDELRCGDRAVLEKIDGMCSSGKEIRMFEKRGQSGILLR